MRSELSCQVISGGGWVIIGFGCFDGVESSEGEDREG